MYVQLPPLRAEVRTVADVMVETRVTSRDQLDEAMRALFASDGPALLCVEQDAELL